MFGIGPRPRHTSSVSDLPANDLPPGERPKRRVRYSGKNPRAFHDKYKELDPERFADDIAKVIASGKTPAGTHRPIMVREILEVLDPKAGEIAVDCTLGYGGHAKELAMALRPNGTLYGLDVDPIEQPKTEQRLRDEGFGPDLFQARLINFAGLPKLLRMESLDGVDMALADLGVSSMQIDNPDRGFTFKSDGPLDLRLNPNHGQPASTLLAKIDVSQLAALLAKNADEPQAQLIAETLVAAQPSSLVTRTQQLATIIRVACGIHSKGKTNLETENTIRRVFQALRIVVNDEFGALDSLLRTLPQCLNSGGRVAIMTFHSGEDRRVKKAFQAGLSSGIYASIAIDVIRPTGQEVNSNPRASSAKLRWAIRS